MFSKSNWFPNPNLPDTIKNKHGKNDNEKWYPYNEKKHFHNIKIDGVSAFLNCLIVQSTKFEKRNYMTNLG